jgi:chromosome segregation protein
LRLKSIKLAGFKSFVDPTHVPLTSNMTAVVGPNGCGKSNIIDAVRWVMGESSAKHLRGESMADVIFNGSVSRKPVSRAAIELVFDNQDGRAPGEFAKYAEISVKREVTRDGQSKYSLNGTVCRRRDVTDLFLGTGLGPRSYAIIEQGMIARLVEAKPEELRTYVEEAAGVSKYKERRRETESRIARTRDNLARLMDLSDELGRQLDRLKRQAESAKRYQELKRDERRAEAAVLWINIQVHQTQQAELDAQLSEYARMLATAEVDRIENERLRIDAQVARTAAAEALDHANTRYYAHSATISRMEAQAAEYDRALTDRRQRQTSMAEELATLEDLIQGDRIAMRDAHARRDALVPDYAALDASKQALQTALGEQTSRRDALQRSRQSVQSEQQRVTQNVQSAQSQCASLERQYNRDQSRHIQIQDALTHLADTDPAVIEDAKREADEAARRLSEREQSVTDCRTILADAEANWGQAQGIFRAAQSDEESALLAVQRIERQLDAEFNAPSEMTAWAATRDEIQGQVIDSIDVPLAHRDAFEAARGHWLSAWIVSALTPELVASMPPGATLVTSEQAQQLVEEIPYYAAFDAALGSGYSDQGLVFGRGWCHRQQPTTQGILALQAARPAASHALEIASQTRVAAMHAMQTAEAAVQQAKQTLQTHERALNDARTLEMQVSHRVIGLTAKAQEMVDLRARLTEEYAQLASELTDLEQQLSDAQTTHSNLIRQRDRLGLDLAPVDAELSSVVRAVQTLQQQRDAIDRQRSQLDLRQERVRAEIEGLERQLIRSTEQLAASRSRYDAICGEIAHLEQHPPFDRADLSRAVQDSAQLEVALADARRVVEDHDEQLRTLERIRDQLEQQRSQWLDAQQRAQMAQQALVIQCQQWQAQLAPLLEARPVVQLEEYLQTHDAVETIEAELTQIRARIERLGPINLVAVDEYQRELERKTELDTQHAELIEALETLEDAIRKIDRETRQLFRQTFEAINQSFGALFPTLFGGGEAWLELTDDDLLSTGVTIMARPPGKRNSTIYLLSGGEKALTALALVFSIFQLNPAPFCLLDEVDAPLDDANVGRYADAVAAMSERVQFIFITHNKLAMERAECLMGVTMSEPGVSRLVSVDIERAVELVTTE